MAATTYGDSGYGVTICTNTTGSVGSETPDTSTGTLLYLYAVDVSGNDESNEKLKYLHGGSSYGLNNGKRTLAVTLTNVYIVKYGAHATNTAAFNEVRHFLYTYGLKSAKARTYLFVKNLADNVYLKLSWNTSGQQTVYMKGSPLSWKWKESKGNLLMFSQLIFKNVET